MMFKKFYSPQLLWAMPEEGLDVLWRAEPKRYSVVIDADMDMYGVSSPQVELRWYPVHRRTPKGAYIDRQTYVSFYREGAEEVRDIDSWQFVLLSSKRRFACPTPQEALVSLQQRRKTQIRILEGQVSKAKQDLEVAEDALDQIDAFLEHLRTKPKV